MENITKRLRHKVEVWKTETFINELGEDDTKGVLDKKAYCEIVPLKAAREEGQANTESNNHKFKFLFRLKSVRDIKKDWFFIYDSNKYSVDYFNKDFKDNQFLEVFTTRVEE